MRIYTSYYAKVSKDLRGLIPVRISTGIPHWFPHICVEFNKLYPGWDLVNGIKSGQLSKEEYTTIYKERLARLDKQAILSELKAISDLYGGRDIVLLCYETPENFCHRHFVAEWLDCDIVELD